MTIDDNRTSSTFKERSSRNQAEDVRYAFVIVQWP